MIPLFSSYCKNIHLYNTKDTPFKFINDFKKKFKILTLMNRGIWYKDCNRIDTTC